jgi:hypothetical protein
LAILGTREITKYLGTLFGRDVPFSKMSSWVLEMIEGKTLNGTTIAFLLLVKPQSYQEYWS